MAVMEQLALLLSPILDHTIVKRVRRNHGFEHATIHMLNQQRYQLSGRASSRGFVIFGEVPTHKVQAAAQDALQRLRDGQANLAVHPHCGTNLVTTGLLTTLVAALGFMGTRRKSAWERFPLVMVFMMLASFYSQPIGMSLQRHITTSGEPGEMEIVSVTRDQMKLPFRNQPVVVHHVVTRSG